MLELLYWNNRIPALINGLGYADVVHLTYTTDGFVICIWDIGTHAYFS